MTNERDSAQVALESILLLISAWNLCPVPGTDISCSMVAIGCKCPFPIVWQTHQVILGAWFCQIVRTGAHQAFVLML